VGLVEKEKVGKSLGTPPGNQSKKEIIPLILCRV